MPKVLIIKCLADDDDDEMLRMSNLIKEKEGERCGVANVKTLDFKDLVALTWNAQKAAALVACGNVANLNDFEVVFAGHSLFFKPNTNFTLTNVRGLAATVRPLAERRIGGYEIEKIAQFVGACIVAGCKSFYFFCCECAVTVDNHLWEHAEQEAELKFSKNETLLRQINTTNQCQVSSLEHLAACLYGEKGLATEETLPHGLVNQVEGKLSGVRVKLKGPNGVGFVTSEHYGRYSFCQDNLAEYKKIDDPRSAIDEDTFFSDYVEGKTSPQVICFNVGGYDD